VDYADGQAAHAFPDGLCTVVISGRLSAPAERQPIPIRYEQRGATLAFGTTPQEGMMAQPRRFTSADLELFPDDGKRYEIIDGDLYVSKQPHYYHQSLCLEAGIALSLWSRETGAGEVGLAPGVIFAEDDDVAPDLVWTSTRRLPSILGTDGKLHAAPDLVIEVLSPGAVNERRDREAKLALYSRRGVHEYWIINWQRRQIEVYRRAAATLQLAATLLEGDVLESPLLPGFAWPLSGAFARVPRS
jgi:Uma2 family endonuclease